MKTPRGEAARKSLAFWRAAFMRHPFWTWTGWLTLSLAGCIHGFDGRKTSTQSVSDQSTSAPLVVGPFRKSPERFAPTDGKTALRGGKSAKPSLPKQVPLPPVAEAQLTAPKSLSNKAPEVRYDSQVVPAQFQPQKTLPQEPVFFPDDVPPQSVVTATQSIPISKPSAINAPSEPAPFAEFDRAIPLSTKSNDSKVTPASSKEPILTPAAENETDVAQNGVAVDEVESSESEAPANSLPMIFPAQTTTPVNAPRELPSQPTGLFQERASVAETSKSTAGPRDVALLVEQVFEDLRQRRLDAARERTEWLKRLVAKGADPTHSHADSANAPATTSNDGASIGISREPKRLDVNDGKALSRDAATSNKASEQPALSADDMPLSK